MNKETKPRQGRRVGRPRVLEGGGASLAAVLNLVRTGTATTRLEIERHAELGRAVVVDRLAILTKFGLVVEGDLGPAIGGRAPRHIRFVAEAGTVLVAVLDRSYLGVALADLSGRLEVEHHEAIDPASGPDDVLDRLTTLFVWLLDERGGKERAWGIGLALPEPITVDAWDNFAAGDGALSRLQAWRNFDFAGELSLRFGAPSWTRSGTQTMTIGELEAGAGRGASDLLFVKLDRSISAGIVSDGALHRGAQGLAGLIGHSPTVELGGFTCNCGSKGCLEVMASGDALARDGATAAREGRSRYLVDMMSRNGEITVNDVGHGAQLGDAYCAEALSRCGRLVGESLAPLVNLLNPGIIVLGGVGALSGEILLASVREAVYRQSHALATRDLRITRSQLGGAAGLIGAAQVVLDEIFSPAAAPAWVTLGSPRLQPSFIESLEALRARQRSETRVASPPTAAPPCSFP
jgi:predicted NBD/HSP70 family sugar kinase